MAFEQQKQEAAAGGWTWDPADPYNWKAIAGQQQAAAKGWTWNPADPSNWTHIAAELAAQPAGAEPGVTAPDASAGEDTSAATNRQLFNAFAQMINDAGLTGLFAVVDGVPTGWLWDQIVSGGMDSEASFQLALEQTDQFKQRYPAIPALRARRAAGEDVFVPSMKDVNDYEKALIDTFTAASVPAWMYDTHEERQQLMINGRSIVEVETMLGAGWERVRNSPPSVRAAYEQMYGVGQGDAALLANFLDPEQTVAKLEKSTRAAYARGMGSNMGLSIDKLLAERLAELPMTDAGLYENLTDVAALENVAVESIGEAGQDLTLENDGIAATFFGDAGAAGRLNRRVIERQAAGKTAAGGAAVTGDGLSI